MSYAVNALHRLASRLFGFGAGLSMALVFSIAGVIGVMVAIVAFNSRAYRQLSAAYARDEAAA